MIDKATGIKRELLKDIKADNVVKPEDEHLDRRDFLKRLAQGGCTLCLFSLLGGSAGLLASRTAQAQDTATQLIEQGIKGPDERFVHQAMHYEKLAELRVRCKLCPKECEVADLERGYCGVRENRGGEYKTLVYNRPCSLNSDPIEKKPFFHFLPGTQAFSLSTAGCNFECRFCQNWQISQYRPEQVQSVYLKPQDIVNLAKRSRCPSIAYTYGEPVVFFEYMYDICKVAREQGVHNVVVSNGYFNEQALRDLCKVASAIKIDLKAFTEKFYKDSCSGTLKPVLRSLEILKEEGVWHEIVVLIVPTLNDSEKEITQMSQWIMKRLGPDVPTHFTRFHPQYKLKNLPPTPINTLERAYNIARKEGLKFVYIGNVPMHKAENTYCPKCGELLIRRTGYYISTINIKDGKCAKCSEPIPGVWS